MQTKKEIHSGWNSGGQIELGAHNACTGSAIQLPLYLRTNSNYKYKYKINPLQIQTYKYKYKYNPVTPLPEN